MCGQQQALTQQDIALHGYPSNILHVIYIYCSYLENIKDVRFAVPYMPRSLLVGEAGCKDRLLPASFVHTRNFSSSCLYSLYVTAKYSFTLILKSVWKLPAI